MPERPDPFYLVMGAIVYAFLWGPARTKVRGRSNLPREGGFVLAANHVSNLDPYAVAYPLFPRQLRFMAKSELVRGLLKPLMYRAGTFPVRRGEADMEAFKTAVPREGRRGRGDVPRGNESQDGAGQAARADPAHGCGPDRARGAGAPVEDLDGLPAREAARRATERLMDAIEQLKATI